MTTSPLLSPDAVIDALARQPAFICSLIGEMSPERRRRRPAPDKWSAHEHACHLDVVHPLFFERLELMLREETPVIEPYFPDQADEDGALLAMDLEASLARFESDRQRLVERLRGLGKHQWRRSARHAEYNRYDIFVMFRHLAMHDFFHAYRIEELLLLAHD